MTTNTMNSTQHNWSRWSPYVLSIVRIIVALLFFEHGLSKMFGFPQPLPPPVLFSLGWFSGAIEFVGGGLLAIGLFSRASAFVMSGEMAFAYSSVMRPIVSSPFSTAAMRRFCTVSYSFISHSPAEGLGALMPNWRGILQH